jgi:hypothetical protein
MHGPAAQYVADVVGARSYTAGKASHVAGVVASGDTLTIRLLAPGPGLSLPDRVAGVLRGPVQHPEGGAADPIQRGLTTWPPTHPASGSCGPQRELPRQPSTPLRATGLAVGISTQHAFPEIEAGTADYTDLSLYSSTTIGALASRLAARYRPGSAAAARGKLTAGFTNQRAPRHRDWGLALLLLRVGGELKQLRRRRGCWGDKPGATTTGSEQTRSRCRDLSGHVGHVCAQPSSGGCNSVTFLERNVTQGQIGDLAWRGWARRR